MIFFSLHCRFHLQTENQNSIYFCSSAHTHAQRLWTSTKPPSSKNHMENRAYIFWTNISPEGPTNLAQSANHHIAFVLYILLHLICSFAHSYAQRIWSLTKSLSSNNYVKKYIFWPIISSKVSTVLMQTASHFSAVIYTYIYIGVCVWGSSPLRSFGMSMHGYADDTQIYTSFCPGLDELSALERLEACVSFIRSWMKENKLKLNDDKTEFIILGSRRNLKKVISKNIWIGEHQIKPSACVRNIGGYFDAEMRMEVQVKETCRTAWFNLLKIRKIREYLTKDQVKTVIHAYITSRLDNNNALLFKLPKVHRSKLQIIQNCAARVIMTGVRKFDHVSPTLYELHWLPIAKRIDFKILLITYKALHGHGPLYLKELLQYKKQYWNTRSADDSSLLEIPKTRLTTYGDHAFYFSAPTLWNRLPLDVRSKPTISSFKHSLKTFLFGEAFFFQLIDWWLFAFHGRFLFSWWNVLLCYLFLCLCNVFASIVKALQIMFMDC